MEFNITPKEIIRTATKLVVEPRNINYEAGNFIAHYTLYDAEGGMVEQGDKTIDIAHIGFLTQNPIDIPSFNLLLAFWALEATDQIIPA